MNSSNWIGKASLFVCFFSLYGADSFSPDAFRVSCSRIRSFEEQLRVLRGLTPADSLDDDNKMILFESILGEEVFGETAQDTALHLLQFYEFSPTLAYSQNGRTLLHVASWWGASRIVSYLLDHGVVSSQNYAGVTPLHEASYSCNGDSFEVVRQLTERFPEDVFLRDIYGKTPIALLSAINEKFCLLYQAGSSINDVDNFGNTCLQNMRNPKDVEQLCKWGADVNKGFVGQTSMIYTPMEFFLKRYSLLMLEKNDHSLLQAEKEKQSVGVLLWHGAFIPAHLSPVYRSVFEDIDDKEHSLLIKEVVCQCSRAITDVATWINARTKLEKKSDEPFGFSETFHKSLGDSYKKALCFLTARQYELGELNVYGVINTEPLQKLTNWVKVYGSLPLLKEAIQDEESNKEVGRQLIENFHHKNWAIDPLVIFQTS